MMISLPKPANASLRRQDARDHQPKQDKDSHNVHGQRLPGKEHHGNKEERRTKAISIARSLLITSFQGVSFQSRRLSLKRSAGPPEAPPHRLAFCHSSAAPRFLHRLLSGHQCAPGRLTRGSHSVESRCKA
jgi:hypothetical protein